MVQKTGEEFKAVGTGSKRVVELMGEIAAASNEQSQGIRQISATIQEMDKTIQQNAANAEEAASASQELNAQALQMRYFVGKLEALVTGKARRLSRSTDHCCDKISRAGLTPASNQPPVNPPATASPAA